MAIGAGWATWSHGYTGEVVWNLAQGTETLNLSGVAAFGLEVEPDAFATETVTFTLSDGQTITDQVNGDAGAQFFGFYGGGVVSVTISDPTSGDFAFGDFFAETVIPPTVNPDFTHVVFGHQDIVAAPGVLANDIPSTSGDTLSVSAVNGNPANVGQSVAGHYGSLQLFSDGDFIYTASGQSALPSSGVSEDFFGYTALEAGSGGGGSASSTLTVVVIAPGMTYLGGQANQTIQGPNGHSPVLDGSAGGDILLAGKGATVLVGGNGDTLTGNAGADTYVFMGPFGQNTITNFNPNNDIIQLDHNEFADLNAVKLAAVNTPSGTVITDPTNSADTITLTGVHPASLHIDASHFLLV